MKPRSPPATAASCCETDFDVPNTGAAPASNAARRATAAKYALARDYLDDMTGMHAKSAPLILTGPTGETALLEGRGFISFEIAPEMAQIAE